MGRTTLARTAAQIVFQRGVASGFYIGILLEIPLRVKGKVAITRVVQFAQAAMAQTSIPVDRLLNSTGPAETWSLILHRATIDQPLFRCGRGRFNGRGSPVRSTRQLENNTGWCDLDSAVLAIEIL